MADAIDAFLELTPNGPPDGKMRNRIAGETADVKKKRSGNQPAAMEVTQFTFANAKALAAKKQQEEMQAVANAQSKPAGDTTKETAAPKPKNLPPVGKVDLARTGRSDEDYRFQIHKQVDVASPFLMQAYFSNSFRGMRPEYNDFKQAKVTFRKTDAKGPKTYLTILFTDVHVVGYELETDGKAAPEETVDFCFQTCEMIYRPQAGTGELGTKNIKGWDFRQQADYSSGGASEEPAA